MWVKSSGILGAPCEIALLWGITRGLDRPIAVSGGHDRRLLQPDPAGRQTAAIDPLGNTHSALYDEAGNAIAEVDAIANATYFDFDALGRQVCTKDMLDNTSTWGYDSVGSLIVSTDAADETTCLHCEALGRRTAQVDAMAGVTYWHYDAAGNAVLLLDAEAHPTYSVLTSAAPSQGRSLLAQDG